MKNVTVKEKKRDKLCDFLSWDFKYKYLSLHFSIHVCNRKRERSFGSGVLIRTTISLLKYKNYHL